MITISVKPRQDNRFDAYVGDEGDHFLNSDQGYENVEDVVAIVRRLWPPIALPKFDGPITYAPEVSGTAVTGVVDVPMEHAQATIDLLRMLTEPVVLEITYRDGTVRSERLR